MTFLIQTILVKTTRHAPRKAEELETPLSIQHGISTNTKTNLIIIIIFIVLVISTEILLTIELIS